VKNHQGPSQTNHKSNREFSKILLEILGLLHGPSTSFFVNFYFYFFLYFFKTSNTNVNSMRKINYFKNDA
jgi:hypothetical protein